MALRSNVKVKLPEKGIVNQKVGKTTYAYYTIRSYRNAKGKPTSDRVSIGKIDEATGDLIPNRNYYEIYKNTEVPEVQCIKSYGLTYLVDSIFKELRIDKVLRNIFPDTADQIIAIAEYMLAEGNIMYYYDDWVDETYPYGNVRLSSQQISRVFKGIDYKRRMEFFKTWIYAREQNEYIVYDVTSISSYSQEIESLEWGYNRDGDDLAQLNYAMYYGEQSLLPLYYCVYPGSITDKTHLISMLRDNELIGCKKARYVLDRGFYTADNLQHLVLAGCRFIMAIPNHLKVSATLIDKHRNDIVNRSECRLGKGLPYAKAVVVEDFGIRAKLHIYYSPSKAIQEEEQLFERIEKEEQALQGMSDAPPGSMRYDRHFKINTNKRGGFGFIRDHEKINIEISRLGFFLILETDFKSTSEEILTIYRRRDVVEKSFNNLKNGLDMKRLYCQSDATMEGKVFVAFISLILRSFMQNRLKDYQLVTGLPFPAILKEMRKLKFVSASDGRKMLAPVTKKQREILYACGFSDEDISSWLKKLTGNACIV
jgi:transposase